MLTLGYHRGRGIAISAILLAVVLLAAIAAALALSSRDGNANSSDSQDALQATTIINQASNLKMGFDKMAASGIGYDQITFDTANGTGLWNPDVGGTVKQYPPAQALVSPTETWRYYPGTFRVGGYEIGTHTGWDYVLVLNNLRGEVCAQINIKLYGAGNSPNAGTYPDTPRTAVVDQSNIDDGTPLDFLLDNTYKATYDRPEGCFQTHDWGDFVYYKTVFEF